MSKLFGPETVVSSIILTAEARELSDTLVGEEIISIESLLSPKRFGVIDLWKIHAGKRYVNVYPRRV